MGEVKAFPILQHLSVTVQCGITAPLLSSTSTFMTIFLIVINVHIAYIIIITITIIIIIIIINRMISKKTKHIQLLLIISEFLTCQMY